MNQRRCYHPTDFGDRQWNRLLAFALSRADSFECAVPYPVVVQDLARAPLWPPELNALRHDVIDRHVSMVRWELAREYPTQFVRLRLTTEVVRFVLGVGGLESWSWERGAPRDPSFFGGDTVLVATDSVDGRIAVYANQEEMAVLAGVGVRLIEPLGVKAEPWPTP